MWDLKVYYYNQTNNNNIFFCYNQMIIIINIFYIPFTWLLYVLIYITYTFLFMSLT